MRMVSCFKKSGKRNFISLQALLFICAPVFVSAQAVTNGSLNGAPTGNNMINSGSATGWTGCGASPDLCTVSFPSYLTTSQVTPSASPDGGNWLGVAALGECAQTTITGLTAGNNYTLYFCAAGFGTGALYNGTPVMPRVCVGATCQTYSYPLATGWNSLSLNFTATAATMTLQVSAPSGNYYASLDGFNLTTPCGVPQIPIANFGASDTTICAGTCISFTDSTTNSPTSWAWSFTGGNLPTSTQQNPANICYAAAGNYTATLTATNAFGSSSFSRTIHVYAPVATAQSISICNGDSVLINGVYQTTPGAYNDTLTSVNGCDSIVTMNLAVLPSQTSAQNISICTGDSVFINGAYQTTAGTYIDTLTSVNGCDSIVTANLTVLTTSSSSQNISICAGDSVLINGVYQTTAGVYTSTLTAVNGCDSIVTVNLAVLLTSSSSQNISICAGDSVLINGVYRTTPGTYTSTLTSVNGCDSIVTVNLAVLPTSSSSQSISICTGDSVLINGTYQTTAGTYADTLTAVNGCDSIVTINLIVIPNVVSLQSISICTGDSVLINGTYENTTGIYTGTFTAANGCDSIVMVDLTVLPSSASTQNVSICTGDSALINGTYQAVAGTYTSTVTSSNGCDSVITTNLSVFDKPIVDLGNDTSLCAGETLLLNATTPNGSYQWQDNSTGATYTVRQQGTYWVQVTVNNCSGQDDIFVAAKPAGCYCRIYLPNAFTPNNDGNNDVFRVFTDCLITDIHLIVFNRWGEKVFDTYNQLDYWNGTYKDAALPGGVYTWLISYRLENEEFSKLHGSVTLIR